MLGSLAGGPPPTRTTPGLPTARCTTSMFLLADIAGATVQFPRMLCKIAAAAPGCPAIAEYCADWAKRPKTIIAADSPIRTPSGIRNAAKRTTRPRITKIATTPMPVMATMGRALGLVLRTIPATMRICLIRPGESASAAFRPAGAPGLFTMLVRIRVRGGPREMRPGNSAARRARRSAAAPASTRTARSGSQRGSHHLAGSARAAVRRLAVQPARPVRRAHQRSGHDTGKAQAAGLLGQLVELRRGHPAVDRVVTRGGAQVLGDRQQLAAGRAEVRHRPADLVPLLAHAQDEAGLGEQAGLAGQGKYVEGSFIAEPRPDPPEDPGYRLDVVRKHFGAGREDLGELPAVRVKVGYQQLHAAAGHCLVDLAAGLAVQPRAAICQVIPGDPGDGGVPQPHGGHRPGDPARLIYVERARLAGGDLAEVASPGALVAADEEGRLAVLPALEDVRAAGLLADRVQAFAPHQLLQLGVLRPGAQPGLDPRGLALDGRLAVADLKPQEAAFFGSEYHCSRVRGKGPSQAQRRWSVSPGAGQMTRVLVS